MRRIRCRSAETNPPLRKSQTRFQKPRERAEARELVQVIERKA
jgi:hypothetical protein